MSTIDSTLTHERLLHCVFYNKDTGVFTSISKRSGVKIGTELGNTRPDGYRRIGIDYTNYLAHRLAWFYVHGDWPSDYIDHIDGNPLNNSISNLRVASQSINTQNFKRASKSSKSQLLGVSYHARDKLWRARIHVDGKNIYIGCFKDPNVAHEAYLSAKRALHPGCTI